MKQNTYLEPEAELLELVPNPEGIDVDGDAEVDAMELELLEPVLGAVAEMLIH